MAMANEAGFNIVGDKYPLDWEDKRTEKGDGQNQSDIGFWEDMNIVDAGANNTNITVPPDALKQHFTKIFTVGLPKTDFAYIDKMILTVREPWSHLQSWRKLFIFNVKDSEGVDIDDLRYPYGTEYVFKYNLFVQDYLKRKYPTLIVDFDDMLANPHKNCQTIKQFVGCGRWDLGQQLIDSSRNRNKLAPRPDKKFEFAPGFFDFIEHLYGRLKDGNLDEALVKDLSQWSQQCANQINVINAAIGPERDARIKKISEQRKIEIAKKHEAEALKKSEEEARKKQIKKLKKGK